MPHKLVSGIGRDPVIRTRDIASKLNEGYQPLDLSIYRG